MKIPNYILLEKSKERGIIQPNDCKKRVEELIEKETTIIKDKIKTVNLDHLYHYYYNCESVQDFGWGCAYRSLQTLLSYKLSLENKYNPEDITFDKIFKTYGKRECLIEKIKKLKNLTEEPECLKNRLFAPFETDNGWIEPFISQIICNDYNITGKLILVNSYPEDAYAPKEFFDNKIYDFKELKQMLFEHFNKENALPVIVDDAKISLCIIGIAECSDGNVLILYMDPHADRDKDPINNIFYVKVGQEGKGLKSKKGYDLRIQFFLNYKYNHWMVFIPDN